MSARKGKSKSVPVGTGVRGRGAGVSTRGVAASRGRGQGAPPQARRMADSESEDYSDEEEARQGSEERTMAVKLTRTPVKPNNNSEPEKGAQTLTLPPLGDPGGVDRSLHPHNTQWCGTHQRLISKG
jgi:hypothetical protein